MTKYDKMQRVYYVKERYLRHADNKSLYSTDRNLFISGRQTVVTKLTFIFYYSHSLLYVVYWI